MCIKWQKRERIDVDEKHRRGRDGHTHFSNFLLLTLPLMMKHTLAFYAETLYGEITR